jgi:hypothetical protein
MSESIKITKEMEELSRLLDQMNSGQYPEGDDEETAGLLEVAGLLKKAGAPICPPQHVLDQTLEQVLAHLPSSRPNRFRTWMYSGALGTVASILLIISLNLIPAWPWRVPSATPPTTSSELGNTTQENSGDKQPLIVSTPSEHRDQAYTLSKVAPTAGENAPVSKEAPPLTTAIVSPPPPKEELTPSNSDRHALYAPTVSESKSVSKSLSPDEPKRLSSALSTLSLPGQVPDSMIIDQESGTIRQVFHKGTPKEIIVTQLFFTKDIRTTKSLTPTMTDMVQESPGAVNTVKVFIFDQEVTIEGRQTKQDLLKLAESLTP